MNLPQVHQTYIYLCRGEMLKTPPISTDDWKNTESHRLMYMFLLCQSRLLKLAA